MSEATMRRRKGPPKVTVEASVEADGSAAVNKPHSPTSAPHPQKGPMMEALWLFILIGAIGGVAGVTSNANVIYLLIGMRSMIALAGYLVMQVGLWAAENKWDAEGSTAWLDAAAEDCGKPNRDVLLAPEALDATFRSTGDNVT